MIPSKEYQDGYQQGYHDAKEEFVYKSSGKWIIDEKDELGRIWNCHCSECGKDPQYYISGTENWWVDELPKFCPNCGSRNVVEEQ